MYPVTSIYSFEQVLVAFFGFSEMLLYLNLFKYLSATILSELPIKRSLLIFFNMHLCSQDSQLNLPSLSLCFQRNKQKRDKSNLQKGKLTTECCWGGRGRVMLPDHIFFAYHLRQEPSTCMNVLKDSGSLP